MRQLHGTTIVRINFGHRHVFTIWSSLRAALEDIGSTHVGPELAQRGVACDGGGAFGLFEYKLADRVEKVHETDSCEYHYWDDGIGVVYDEDEERIHVLPIGED
jgi:hypothetical protein